jgi:alpha-1,6-mannosyltransferase
MKICDIAHSYAPQGGGIRTYLERKITRYSSREGWSHVLIVPGSKDLSYQVGRTSRHELRSPLIPGRTGRRLLVDRTRLRRILEEERPDVIEVADLYLLHGPVMAHRRCRPCAVVAFHHTDLDRAYVETAVHRWAGPWAARLAGSWCRREMARRYREYDRVLASSPSVAARLVHLGVREVRLIPLGVDLVDYHPSRRDEHLRRHLAPRQEVLLVYRGRLHEEKGVDVLVSAVRLARTRIPVRLVMCGDGPMRARLEDIAAREHYLQLLPYQRDPRASATLLASADLYVTAGPHETFGLSVLEAQSCGLPVVGVRAGALMDRVTDATGLLAHPGDPEDLARCIVDLATNGRRAKGREARRMVESCYSWERTFDALDRTYLDLAPVPRRAVP